MKKIVKLSALLITMLLSINVVKADDICENLELYANNLNDFLNYGNVYMNYGSTNYHYEKYNFRDDSNSSYTGYCRNAGWSAGVKFPQTYKCSDSIFDTSDKSVSSRKKMYDAGIAEILKNGYSAVKGSSDYNLLTATSIALRTYEMFWPEFNTNGSNTESINYAHQYYVNKWNDDEEIKKLLKDTVGSVKGDYSRAITVNSITSARYSSGTNLTSTIETTARNLLIKGLNAAKKYKTDGAATITYLETVSKSPVTTNSQGNKEYKLQVKYKFDISKFNSNNAYVKFQFNCKNCNSLGVSYKLYANDKAIANGANLLSLISNGTGIVNFVIEFTTTSKTYNCESLNYSFNIEYYDDSINTLAYNMYSTSCSRGTNCQQFYLLYDDNAKRKISLDDTIELCTTNCETVEAQCKSGNSAACKIYNEEFGGSCVGCSAYISNDKCYDDKSSSLSVKEGYTSSDACGTNASTKPNILSCIINKSDNLGNSYRNNKIKASYCSVWCKEDYHFEMPGNKELNSGRYFSLAASIKGTKTCYTSSIARGQFEGDLKAAQERLVEAYNLYTFKKKANEASLNEEEKEITYSITYKNDIEQKTCKQSVSSCSAAKRTATIKYNQCIRVFDAATCSYIKIPTCNSQGIIDGVDCASVGTKTIVETTYDSIKITQYKGEWTWSGYTPEGGTKTSAPMSVEGLSGAGTFKYESGKVECPSGCSISGNTIICYNVSGKCEAKNGVSLKELFSNGVVSAAKNELKNAYGVGSMTAGVFSENGKPISPPASSGIPGSSLIGVISNFNYCSAWTMDYKFDPDMYFWYEDSYMNSVKTDMMKTVGKVSLDDSQEELRCAGSVDNSYESCSSGWTSAYISAPKNLFVCNPDGSGCEFRDYMIAATSRMKASLNGKVSYVTPTQFYTIYPSGAVVSAEEGADIENSSVLPNGLPVGLGTPAGVYNYTLIVENLGEYYDTGKLGRVWGDHKSVISMTLKENDNCRKDAALKESVNIKGTYIDEGVYNCAYKVNCPDCPVDCNPVCKNPNCPNGECQTECDPPCVYNGDSNIDYRPITPEDINPNDRELGENWHFNKDKITTALELKAYLTTEEIEKNGESIYDVYFENNNDNSYAMKVTMDSKMISKIRAYNDKHKNYINNTLKCYDYVNDNDKKTYKNIYCYSTFIDELMYDKELKNNIQINPKNSRIIGTDASSTDKLRKVKTQMSGYWTTFSEANLNKITIKTEHGIAYYQENYKSIGIGPSWK